MESLSLISAFLSDHPQILITTAGLSILLLVVSIIVLPLLIVRIPHDYFSRANTQHRKLKNRTLAGLFLGLFRNLFALIVIVMGIIMLVLPGQGLLTILAGFFLLDIPAKYALERRIVSQPSILKSINWIRKRRNKLPLTL